MKKTLLLLLLFFAAFNLTYSGDGIRVDRSNFGLPDDIHPVYVAPAHTPSPFVTLGPQRQVGTLTVGPEILTGLDGWYDYMTNGDCRHYIQVDRNTPGNICVIYTTSDSTEPAGATSRRTRLSYSTDGGSTWTVVGMVPSDIRSGFGNMIMKPTGEELIMLHAAIPSALNSQLAVDVAPQAGTFTNYSAQLPSRIWPEPAYLTNGNILMVGNNNVTAAPDSLGFAIFNGTTISSWTNLISYTTVLSNQRWSTASGSNGNAIVISDPVSYTTDTLNSLIVRSFITTNNGTSFSAGPSAFRPFVKSNGDTVTPFFGLDVTYKPGTTNWYLAINGVGAFYSSAALYLTRSTNLTPVIIADSTTVPVWGGPNNSNTIAGVIGIDHPSLGWSSDGNILYCAFSVALNDTGSRGYNLRAIYYSYSTNNGDSWATPIRLTDPGQYDYGYPSVSNWNAGNSGATYELNVTYMKDPGDGPSSFNAGGTLLPATHNHQIYRKITQAAGPIGILGNGNQLPIKFQLAQNYPNPFNPSTVIEYSIPKNTFVTIKVYDILGREVKTLVNEFQQAGYKTVNFNASGFASGVYYYTISADQFRDTKKMILVK